MLYNQVSVPAASRQPTISNDYTRSIIIEKVALSTTWDFGQFISAKLAFYKQLPRYVDAYRFFPLIKSLDQIFGDNFFMFYWVIFRNRNNLLKHLLNGGVELKRIDSLLAICLRLGVDFSLLRREVYLFSWIYLYVFFSILLSP